MNLVLSISLLSDNIKTAVVDNLELTSGWFAKSHVALWALANGLSVGEKNAFHSAGGALDLEVVRVRGWDGSSEFVSSFLDVLG